MELKLSVEEHEFLFNVLEQRHQELLSEIAHTEDREFKKGLRRDEQLLESLVSRLRETATVQRVHV